MKIKDIALMAEVSPSTVSRVINNSGYVKAEVRKRVEQIIEQTGYQPNEIAKSLKTKKTNLIAVIVPKINSEAVSRVVYGVTEVANKHNYQLLIVNTNANLSDLQEEINYLRLFQKKSVDGIIFMVSALTAEHKEAIRQLKIPIVYFGQQIPNEAYVIHNDYEAGKAVMQLLIENGHREIAFIGVDPKDVAVGQKRKQAYLDVLKENGIAFNEKLVGISDFSMHSAYQSIKRIMERGVQPTAIFAVTDSIAYGAIHYLTEQGVHVPNQVSVVGMGDGQIAEFFNPGLTTVHFHQKTAGMEACNILINMIDEGASEKNTVVMGYEIMERQSVKKR